MVHTTVGIIGSGPGGLGAAYALREASPDLLAAKVSAAIYDKADQTSGGLKNDCKMMLTEDIGVDKAIIEAVGRPRIRTYIDNWDRWCMSHGDPQPASGQDMDAIHMWQEKLRREAELELIVNTKQRHYGTDGSKKIIDGIKADLEDAGVSYFLETSVRGIKRRQSGRWVLHTSSGIDTCEYLVISPGRLVDDFLLNIYAQFGIPFTVNPIEVGVRLVTLFETFMDLTNVIHDPKIKGIINKTNMKIFCTNPGGRLIRDNGDKIKYNRSKYPMVNGDGLKKVKSGVTNTAILQKRNFTDPPGDTAEYGRLLARSAFACTNGNILVQRLGRFFAKPRPKKGAIGMNFQMVITDNLNH